MTVCSKYQENKTKGIFIETIDYEKVAEIYVAEIL